MPEGSAVLALDVSKSLPLFVGCTAAVANSVSAAAAVAKRARAA